MIGLTIDEVGMAKTPEDKLRIADRLIEVACGEFGLPQADLMIDPLTFTIATGVEDDRKLGLWTLEGIRLIREKYPEVQIILGLSNISFGLDAAARAVLNSVFLDHAVKAGMTGAIVHVSKIRPLHLIAAEEVQVAEDLIFDRRREDYDPLQKLLSLFSRRKAEDATAKRRAETPEERLKDRIVDGDRKGIEGDLAAAMEKIVPLNIINDAQRDVIGLQVVTVGQKASDLARDWFEANRYQDYLYLHGLSVEIAEAMAEYTHKRMRAELGFSGEDARDREKLLAQGYRGSRYSFGYPACLRLEDQTSILNLLEADKMEISLSDGYQLHPEQSTPRS